MRQSTFPAATALPRPRLLPTGGMLWMAMAALVFLAGCASAPRYDTLRSPPPAEVLPVVVNSAPAPTDDSLPPPPAETLRQIEPGTGVFIDRDAARRPRPAPQAAGEVTFNFEGESLHAVIKAILGDFLQENYVIAPGVQGTVTFSTAKALRGEQALSILEMLLRWNNATLVWEDGRYTILPIAQAIPGNLTPRLDAAGNARGYEVRAVPLEYISATEMEKLLKPYARPDAVVSVDNARNLIVLAGTSAELTNYLQTIDIFDVDWLSGMSVGIFPMQQTEATKIVTELDSVFGAGADTPMAGMFRFLPLEGINSVLVITPQPEYLAKAEEWLNRLDAGAGGAGQRLYVYDVKNVKAQDLADTLSDVFGTGSSRSTVAPAGDFIAPGLEPVEIRTIGTNGQTDPNVPRRQESNRNTGAKRLNEDGIESAVPNGPVVDAAGGIALAATDEVRISAVEDNNALLVLATSSQWESIRHVIERLDQIPLQVQIEAQIVQVTLNERLEYGVQWFFENSIPAAYAARATSQNWWSDVAGSISDAGIGWTFVGKNMAAIIEALDSVTDVRVLSAPSLVVLNNKQASINVGTQIPVESVVINNPLNPGTGNTGGVGYTQYRDTGITLEVTPRVNPGGLVFMEVTQDDSEALEASVGNNFSVRQRTITTEIAVQSGETVLLGGLIKQTHTNNKGGVPFLSRIPVLGALFGGQTRSSDREELLVMIKPTVIRNSAEARRITDEYRARFRGIEPLRVIVDPQ